MKTSSNQNSYCLSRSSLVFILLICSVLSTRAQVNEYSKSIKFGLGLTDNNGIKLSSEFAIPISKLFELNPSFIYSSSGSYAYKQILIENDAIALNEFNTSYPIAGHSAGLFFLYFGFKPLSLIHSGKTSNHQLGIGIGPYYTFYSSMYFMYGEATQKIERFSYKTNNSIGFCFINFSYAYSLNNSTSIGLNGALFEIDGEPSFLYGLTIGFKISDKQNRDQIL